MTRFILLRGLMRDQRHWELFPQYLAEYFPEAQIETPDLAGNGSRTQYKSASSVTAMVNDTRQQCSSNDVPAFLIAISMGGMIATQWAIEKPKEIAGIVLINSSLRQFSPFYKRLNPKCYLSALQAILSGNLTRQEQWILRWTSTNHSSSATLLKRWAQYAQSGHPTLANSLRQLCAAAKYKGSLEKPAPPILILNGANDRLVHPSCSSTIAQSWRCPIYTHPTAGHDLGLDDPNWLALHISNWYQSIKITRLNSMLG